MSQPPHPRVSVILTVYKRTRFLREALHAALGQTLRDIEIIVTDDSASPEIQAICESGGDPRIRYRSNTPTLGVALNVRAALGEATGDYIAILNDDDAWEPRFLETLVRALDDDPRRALAFADHWIVDDEGRIDDVASRANTIAFGRDRLTPGDQLDPLQLVLGRNAVPLAMAAVFRRDALPAETLIADVVGAYDLWISAHLALHGRPFHYVPERLTRYRSHPAMETARLAPDKAENAVFIYRTLLDDPRFASFARILRRRLADALIESGKARLRFEQLADARHAFRGAMRTSPSLRAVGGWLLSMAPGRVRRRFGLASVGASAS